MKEKKKIKMKQKEGSVPIQLVIGSESVASDPTTSIVSAPT